MSKESLKHKTVNGVAWSGLDNVVQMGVSFIVGIVLARLLTPDDYGLLGIILIFSNISTALINSGFNTALIRKKDATNDDYNTSFIANMALSIFFYAVIFALSPQIAEFFDREELVGLTRVASLSIVIGAFSMVQQTRLTKRIDFKSQTKITLISSVVSGFLGIGMALLDFGVWSLVAQLIASQSLRTILLCAYDKWLPRLKFSSKSFHDLFGFGWKMMVSALLDSLWKELYQVVVGKFYNPATLGQYTRAKHFSQLFSSNLTNVIQRVTYPVLSNIQDDRQHMVSAYRKMIKTTMFVAAVSMFFLGAISEPLLYCLIGPKWHEAATYLPLICIAGSTYPLHAINLNMLQVQGRSDLFLGLEVIKKILFLAPLFVGAFVGIMPMLYVNLLINVIAFFLNSYYSGKFLGYSSWMQIRDVSLSYGVATIMALSVFFLRYIPLSYWFVLPLQLIVGSTVFFLMCEALKPDEYREIKGILLPLLKKMRR